jgi:hypothetical protein
MHMFSRALPAATATALCCAGLAVAAAPTAGGTYSGKVNVPGPDTNAPTLKLKVAGTGKSLKAILDCGSEGNYTMKNVAITNGKFHKKGKIQKIDFEIQGSFKSATKAKGSLDTVLCFVNQGTFTAKRK